MDAAGGLQRSVTSFRRQGSSGLVWEDRFASGELAKKEEELNNEGKPSESVGSVGPIRIERNRSGGARGYRTGKVTPSLDPPSPKVSGCGGLCGVFAKPAPTDRPKTKTGKRKV